MVQVSAKAWYSSCSRINLRRTKTIFDRKGYCSMSVEFGNKNQNTTLRNVMPSELPTLELTFTVYVSISAA